MLARSIFCIIGLALSIWVESRSMKRPLIAPECWFAGPAESEKPRQRLLAGPKIRYPKYSYSELSQSRSWKKLDSGRSLVKGNLLSSSFETTELLFPRFVTSKDSFVNVHAQNPNYSKIWPDTRPHFLHIILSIFGSAAIRCLAGLTASYLVAVFIATPVLAVSQVEKEQLLKFGWLHNLIELIQHRGPLQFFFGEPQTVWRLSRLPICVSISIALIDLVRDTTCMSRSPSVESETQKRRHKVAEILGYSILMMLVGSFVSMLYAGVHLEIALLGGTRDVGVALAIAWIALYRLALELLSLSASGQRLLSFCHFPSCSIFFVVALVASQSYPYIISSLGFRAVVPTDPGTSIIHDAIMVMLYTVTFHSLYSRCNCIVPFGRDF